MGFVGNGLAIIGGIIVAIFYNQFLGSVLTVVGVAFFAQWSLLSNITSSIIIFFNHPVKLNDSIVILEGKDYDNVSTLPHRLHIMCTFPVPCLPWEAVPFDIFLS